MGWRAAWARRASCRAVEPRERPEVETSTGGRVEGELAGVHAPPEEPAEGEGIERACVRGEEQEALGRKQSIDVVQEDREVAFQSPGLAGGPMAIRRRVQDDTV